MISISEISHAADLCEEHMQELASIKTVNWKAEYEETKQTYQHLQELMASLMSDKYLNALSIALEQLDVRYYQVVENDKYNEVKDIRQAVATLDKLYDALEEVQKEEHIS